MATMMRFLISLLLLLAVSVQAQLNPSAFTKTFINSPDGATARSNLLSTVPQLVSNGATSSGNLYQVTGLTAGVTYFYSCQGGEFLIQEDENEFHYSSSFVAFGTTVFIQTVSASSLIVSKIYGPNQNIIGTFTGSGTNLGGVALTANNGADFTDKTAVRSNIFAVVTDDLSGSLALTESGITLGYGSAAQSGSGDSIFFIQNGSSSPYNSGASFNHKVMYQSGANAMSVLDPVGSQFIHEPTNRLASLIPGVSLLVFNNNANMKGLGVASPSLAGFSGDSGNYMLQFDDFINKKFRIPKWTGGVYQPGDLFYAFTVSGVTTSPAFNSLYTNSSGAVWCMISNSISAGSGTIYATARTAPAGTGTLGKHAKSIGVGDATFTYSAATLFREWQDSFTVEPATGITTTRELLYRANLYPKTASFNVSTNESGGHYQNTGAAGTITASLPTAVIGLTYKFDVGVAQSLVIDADTSDVIQYSTSVTAASGSINSSTKGSSITLTCTSANVWFAESMVGVWLP